MRRWYLMTSSSKARHVSCVGALDQSQVAIGRRSGNSGGCHEIGEDGPRRPWRSHCGPFCRSGRGIYSTPQITQVSGLCLHNRRSQRSCANARAPPAPWKPGTDLHPQPQSTIARTCSSTGCAAWPGSASPIDHCTPSQAMKPLPRLCHPCHMPAAATRQTATATAAGHHLDWRSKGPCQQKHGGQQPKRTKTCCHGVRWLQRMANCGRRMARRHACSVANRSMTDIYPAFTGTYTK